MKRTHRVVIEGRDPHCRASGVVSYVDGTAEKAIAGYRKQFGKLPDEVENENCDVFEIAKGLRQKISKGRKR